MLQSVPLFPLSTEWRARGPHCHSSEVQRATLRVPVHCAYLVEPTLSLKCFLRAHTQTGKVSAVCSVEHHILTSIFCLIFRPCRLLAGSCSPGPRSSLTSRAAGAGVEL